MFIKKAFLNYKGFTLIEAMIAMMILIIAILGTAALQGTFATGTADRQRLNCVVDAATSALNRCLAENPSGTYNCEGGLTATVNITGSCPPAIATTTCNNTIVSTATSGNKSFSLTTIVCNYE